MFSASSVILRSAKSTLKNAFSAQPTTTTESLKDRLPGDLAIRAPQTTTALPPQVTNSSGLAPVDVGAIFVGSFFTFLLIVTLILLYLQVRHGRQYFSLPLLSRLGRVSPHERAPSLVQPVSPSASVTPAVPPMTHHAADHESLRGFGRFGYNPIESHLRLQRNNPTMVPKVGGLTRFMVGERLAHNFTAKVAGTPIPSTLSDSDKSSSAQPHH